MASQLETVKYHRTQCDLIFACGGSTLSKVLLCGSMCVLLFLYYLMCGCFYNVRVFFFVLCVVIFVRCGCFC
jgi:hypothetical protein